LLCPATAYRCAGKLVHRAVDPVEVVVGELAPPLLDLTAHLLPLASEDVRIHRVSPPFSLSAASELASQTARQQDVCRTPRADSCKSYPVNPSDLAWRAAWRGRRCSINDHDRVGITAALNT